MYYSYLSEEYLELIAGGCAFWSLKEGNRLPFEVRYRIAYPNGYELSIIKLVGENHGWLTDRSYGASDNLWEIALFRDGKFVNLGDDVGVSIGWLTEYDVLAISRLVRGIREEGRNEGLLPGYYRA